MFLWQTESSDVSAPLGSVEGFSICFPLCLMVKSSRGKYFLKKQTPLKTRCVVCIQDFTEIGCVLQFSSRNTDQTSKQRQGITCQPIGKCVAVKRSCCGMGTGSISGGYVAKQQTENWGKRTGIYILVVIQEQVDVGVGWIWPVWKVCKYLVDGEWQAWKVPTKCMDLGEMRNGLGLRQSAQDKNNWDSCLDRRV